MRVTLPPNVAKIVELTSDGDHRIAATAGVRVELDRGVYRLDATNGRYLGIVQGVNHGEGEGSVVICNKDWKEAFKAGGKKDDLIVTYDGQQIGLTRGKSTMMVAPLEGKFPNCDHVVPRQAPMFAVNVDPLLLLEVLRVAATITDDEKKGVQLAFYGKETKDGLQGLLGVMYQGISGQTFDGILVPLSGEKKPKAKPGESHEVNGHAA